MPKEEFFKTILAALIITFSWSLAATAMAGESRLSGTQWMWSETSPVSSAAANALADGRMVRGLRLAENALERATTKRERLVAHHNLCIAHAARSKTRIAERHCQTTRRLADPGFVISDMYGRVTALELLQTNLTRLGHPDLGALTY